MALSAVLRGVESGKPLPVKFSLSVAYLILSTLMFSYYRFKLGSDFHYPWMQRMFALSASEPTRYTFSCKQFMAIIGGGVSEFITSIAIIMSFNAASKANIN